MHRQRIGAVVIVLDPQTLTFIRLARRCHRLHRLVAREEDRLARNTNMQDADPFVLWDLLGEQADALTEIGSQYDRLPALIRLAVEDPEELAPAA